ARAERGQSYRGIPPEQVSDAMMAGLAEDRFEIPVDGTADLMERARTGFDAALAAMNGRR
ncbi:MAG: hypothetical protein P8Y02_01005, partial [Deinococcales bacterium]